MRAKRTSLVVLTLSILATGLTRGDDILYRYKGDVPLLDPSTGWISANTCADPCGAAVSDGHFVVSWSTGFDIAGYHLWIAQPPVQPPQSLWAEWRFRSDDMVDAACFGDDAYVIIKFRDVLELVYLHGDAAIAFNGGFGVSGLDTSEFHTHRFESEGGRSFKFSVDGITYWQSEDDEGNGYSSIQIGGIGGCSLPTTDEWDFVRYGTLGGGERVISTDPPEGFLDARIHAATDRFVVTFDAPNYVYVDDIDVVVIDALGGGLLPELTPVVLKTWRREPPDPFDVEDDPRIVEIVLDRPIPFNATTLFTFSEGATPTGVSYTFALGDADGNGSVDLADIAYLQNCAGLDDTAGVCGVFDFNRDGLVDIDDCVGAVSIIADPSPPRRPGAQKVE